MSPTGRFENEKVQERTAELAAAAAAAAGQPAGPCEQVLQTGVAGRRLSGDRNLRRY